MNKTKKVFKLQRPKYLHKRNLTSSEVQEMVNNLSDNFN